MFFWISKLLSFLLSPLVWVLALLIWSFLTKKAKRKKVTVVCATMLLLIFSNPFLINQVLLRWETRPVEIVNFNTTKPIGIVPGGLLRYFDTESVRPCYGSAADRIMQAITLYREGKIQKILISGGSGKLIQNSVKESMVLKSLLEKTGIPSSDILTEDQSRNTYENALYSSVLLTELNLTGEHILITSGLHMKRALACFKKQGINVIPFSVDQASGTQEYTPDKLFIPSIEAMDKWNRLFHEWVGYAAYYVMGYIE
jgi:uncharacterized SAM-binding protein YcdF (DUF218 family)